MGLCRSRDAYVAGVCAGIAERLDFDAIVIRILAILLTLVTFGLAAIAYVVLWVRLPVEPEPATPYDITPERAESIARGSLDFNSRAGYLQGGSDEDGRLSLVPRLVIAVGLMLLFLGVAMNVAPIVSGTRWWQFWPVAFLILGLCLIIIPVRTRYEAIWHAVGIAVTSIAAMALPMSLGVVAWETFAVAFRHMWPLIALAIGVFVVGIYRKADFLIVAGALCWAAFCLAALMFFSLPGEMGALFINMPDGSSMRIAILAS